MPSTEHSNDRGGDGGAPPPPTRCVVWHGGGAPPPGELVRTLARRGVAVELCAGQYATMAAVMRPASEPRGSEPAAGEGGGVAVLLVHPASLPGAAELVRALQHYAPLVARWRYDAKANPALAAIVDTEVASWRPRPPAAATPAATPAPTSPRRDAPPAFRLVGEATDAARESPSPRDPHPLLTNDELEMLLTGRQRPRSKASGDPANGDRP